MQRPVGVPEPERQPGILPENQFISLLLVVPWGTLRITPVPPSEVIGRVNDTGWEVRPQVCRGDVPVTVN